MGNVHKEMAPLDDGQQHLVSSSSKNLKFILDNGEELSANSDIMSSNSPVIKKTMLEHGASTIDVHNFSKDAVECFLDACHADVLKAEIPPSVFRDVNQLANEFEVAWLIVSCLINFESMVKNLKDNDFPSQLYLFDEAMFCLIELKKNNFYDIFKIKCTSQKSMLENFVTNYLTDISSCSTEKLDAILDLSDKQEHILVKVLVNSIRLDNSSLNTNTRRVLEKLDFTNFSLEHDLLYNTLLEMLETIENPSKEDYKLLLTIFRKSVRINSVIRLNSNSKNRIAFPNLFLGLNPYLRSLSLLDEIFTFLTESPHVTNSFIFHDAMETWLVNNNCRRILAASTIGLFIEMLREQMLSKKWQPLAEEYLIGETGSALRALAIAILGNEDLTTKTGYQRLTSSKEYTPDELFSVDHYIELMKPTSSYNVGMPEGLTFTLRIEAASGANDDSFDIKLITDLMALFKEECLSPKQMFNAYPIFVESIHFTLDITKEDGTRVLNVPVSWCDKPHRDRSGKYWCWGPHCFYNEGQGQQPANKYETWFNYWGSQARIRPVVYYNTILRS